MSQYEELTTTMTDQQYLVEALTEMGYKPDVQTEGTALRGYGGLNWNRPVQVTIPREQLRGALAPVGFGRDEAGVFHAVIDDLDRKCSGLDESWLGRVAQVKRRTDQRCSCVSLFANERARRTIMQEKLITIEI